MAACVGTKPRRDQNEKSIFPGFHSPVESSLSKDYFVKLLIGFPKLLNAFCSDNEVSRRSATQAANGFGRIPMALDGVSNLPFFCAGPCLSLSCFLKCGSVNKKKKTLCWVNLESFAFLMTTAGHPGLFGVCEKL